MTTSATRLKRVVSSGEPIGDFWLTYYRDSLRSHVHDALLEAYRYAQSQGLGKSALARQLGRRPEQITRWLSAPGNMELDTLSDLAIALGLKPKVILESAFGQYRSNQTSRVYDDGKVTVLRPYDNDDVIATTLDREY